MCNTLPTDQLFSLEFQFESVFNLEFQPKFGIQLGIPISMGIDLGEWTIKAHRDQGFMDDTCAFHVEQETESQLIVI